MASPRPQSVMIAGGGMGGLTAAIALMRRGFKVRIFEQSASLREVGAGLTLATTAMRVFDDIGVWPAVRQVSTHGNGLAFVHYQTAELLHGRHDYQWSRKPETPEDSAHAHRAAVHAILVEAVRALDPGALVLDRRIVAVEQDASQVRLRFAAGEPAQGDLLVSRRSDYDSLNEGVG